MPAINFKKQFAEKVERGIKRQTIRALREDGRNPHNGDKLYLYVGQRTKGCRKLGEATCSSVHQITIDQYGVNLDGNWLKAADCEQIAFHDGFISFHEMRLFFEKEHGLPFNGLLIKW